MAFAVASFLNLSEHESNRYLISYTCVVALADAFHVVVKWATEALDEVRRGAWNEARALARKEPQRRRGRPRADAPPRPGSVSFSEEVAGLLRVVDAGIGVAEAAAGLDISRGRAYRLLAGAGHSRGRPRRRITAEENAQVIVVFTETGSINQAAIRAGMSHSAARLVLAGKGLVAAETRASGKPDARVKFLELIAQGLSVSQAASEVGVHRRTGRDWAQGIRKVGNTRVYPDGTVVDYRARTRYSSPVTSPVASGDRYLSLDDRLAIADGLINKFTLTVIAAGIGKHVSTVSCEVSQRSIEGVYLPHHADRDAAAARARPKGSKLITHPRLRAAVEQGLERKLSPEQISHRLIKDHPDDESMRVSHETIYQALYFQARGGLKREVQQALRTGRTRRKPHRRPDCRRTTSHVGRCTT